MNTNQNQTFFLPMSRKLLFGFFVAVALVAGVTAWCFASGLTWSAICLIVIAAPLSLLFWYMFYVNPARAVIITEEKSLVVTVPPFLNLEINYQDIKSIKQVDCKTLLKKIKPVKGMSWGSYKSGTFLLGGSKEAFVATSQNNALYLETANKIFILGPSDLDLLENILQEKTA